jgi:hypothetical protein
MRSIGVAATFLVVGLLAGAAASAVVRPKQSAPIPGSAPALSQPRTLPVPTIYIHADDELSARVQALESRLSADHSPSPNASGTNVDLESDRRASLEEKRALFRARGERLAREQKDPRWAADATAKLTSDLAKFQPERGFTSSVVDCRTTMCSAQLQWPSQREALEKTHALVMSELSLNCERHWLIEENGSATIQFDCEDVRATDP